METQLSPLYEWQTFINTYPSLYTQHIFYDFHAIPSSIQGLLLALYSGITVFGLWGTLWISKDWTKTGNMN